ncbi:hypothetical protein BRC82_05390 [Halobacteriales archaeon QS_1_67_19]|nr:MAG: hypothetical protein BRC82_05390 [Halobacteriales archaeon QS_1_67_19]
MTQFDSATLEGVVMDGCTDLEQRDIRALTEKMTVLPEGGGVYSVTTESGSEYLIDSREGRCTCPDFEYNGARCKHIRRVEYATGEQTVPDWADSDAIDSLLGEHAEASPKVAATDGGDVIVADDDGMILDSDDTNEENGRPDDCQCWDPDSELPCFPCWREGFRESNPKATDD